MEAIELRAHILQSQAGMATKPRYLRMKNVYSFSDEQLRVIIQHGYVLTTYNLDSYDYRGESVLKSFTDPLDKLSPNTKGAFISIQRDLLEASAQSTGDIIDYLTHKGYQIVSLDECLDIGAPRDAGKLPGDRTAQGPISEMDENASRAQLARSLPWPL